MNRKQLIVMWAGILVIVAMCLFPPWRYHFHYSNAGRTQDSIIAGPYWPIFMGQPKVPISEYIDSIPAFKGRNQQYWDAEVDFERLLLPIAAMIIIIAGFWVTFRDRSKA